MAGVFQFDFSLSSCQESSLHVKIDDIPIMSERDLDTHRHKLDYLQTCIANLEDLKMEIQEDETIHLKYHRWFKPAPFRFRKTFAKIERAIKYLEAKIAVWEIQNM